MTRTGRAAAAAALALALAAGPAAAEGTPVVYVAQGQALFSFEAPDGWTIRPGVDVPRAAMPDGRTPAPRVISIMPGEGDGAMWAGVWSPPGVATLKQADAYLERLAPRMITAWSPVSEESARVNGAPARFHRGEGMRGDRGVVGRFAAVDLGGGRVAVAAFIGTPAAQEAHAAALKAALDSISPQDGSAR